MVSDSPPCSSLAPAACPWPCPVLAHFSNLKTMPSIRAPCLDKACPKTTSATALPKDQTPNWQSTWEFRAQVSLSFQTECYLSSQPEVGEGRLALGKPVVRIERFKSHIASMLCPNSPFCILSSSSHDTELFFLADYISYQSLCNLHPLGSSSKRIPM